MTPKSSEPIKEIIDRYTDTGELEAAVEAAEQHVFDMIRKTGDGVPTVMMVQILDLWSEWTNRLFVGTIANLTGQLQGWTTDEVDTMSEQMINSLALLKHDSYRAVLQMADERADDDA